MIQNQRYRIPKPAGFTVPELLISGLLGLIVVLAGGFILNINLSTDRRVSELSKQRNNLSFTLDFISREIRQSRRIVLNDDLTANAQCKTSNRQPILSLEIPRDSGGFHIITYAVQPMSSSQIWQGPHAIYRCGPSFTAEGRYTDNSTQQADLVIDSVANQDALGTAAGACAALGTQPNPHHSAAVQADLLESQRLASLLIGLVVRPNQGEQQVICDHRLVAPRS